LNREVKEMADEKTDELDPRRGYWVNSQEGDIIRSDGRRGFWSNEPPSPEFRAERRKILSQKK
jgi:hypothetical protein